MVGIVSRLSCSICKGPTLYDRRLRDDKILIAWIICLVLIRIWLVQAQDLIATSTPHDDYLFIKLARNILSGEWLGPYDQFTLIKGPGFPLFIAAAHLANIPLMLAEHLLYSLFCVIAVIAVKPLFNSRYPLMFIFVFLLFNPFMYMFPATGRVFRFSISMPLVLAVFSIAIGLLVRASSALPRLFIWSTLFAFSFTYLWFTREEGIWMIPALLIFGLYFLVIDIHEDTKVIISRIICLIWITLIFFGVKLSLQEINNKYYGAPVIVELKTPEFQSALGGLMAIDGLGSTRLLPVSWQSQKAGIKVSPTLKELEEYLPEKKDRARVMNSFYIWNFRDLVKKSGNANSLNEALDFYKRVGEEIATACADGTLDCIDRKPSIRPVWKKEYNKLLYSTFPDLTHQAISFRRLGIDKSSFLNWTTTASAEQVRDYKFVTRENLTPGYKKHIAAYPEYYKRIIENKFRILSDIASYYRSLALYLFSIAFIFNIYMIGNSVFKSESLFYALVGLIILIAIVTLIAILSYIKITLWPINRPILSAYMLVLIYISLMLSFMGSRGTRGNNATSDKMQ